VILPAALRGAAPAITLRDPASSVAPGQHSPGAHASAEGASAILSLGARDRGIHERDRQGH